MKKYLYGRFQSGGKKKRSRVARGFRGNKAYILACLHGGACDSVFSALKRSVSMSEKNPQQKATKSHNQRPFVGLLHVPTVD
jgi:hypothetical protein